MHHFSETAKNKSQRVFLPLLVFTMFFVGVAMFHSLTKNGFSVQAASANDLQVRGTTLTKVDGSRFLVRGVNMEFFRDQACSAVTTDQYAKRGQIAQKLTGLGINAVRLNYNRSGNWLGQPGNITKFLDMMQTLAQSGIYSMPSDHSYTGGGLTAHRNSFPLFQQIVEGARSRGIESYLIMNPYNEPGTQDQAQWIDANTDTLSYLRNSLGFRGVVVLDTTFWAGEFVPASMNAVRNYDAALLGGTANVVFSNHWYPNIPLSTALNTFNNANTQPLLIGEMGQINPGSSPLSPAYVVNIFNALISNGIPRGHNGAFPWIWNWCDQNSMTGSDYLTFNSYGNLIQTNFYSKTSSTSVFPYAVTVQATSQNASAASDGTKAIDGDVATSWNAGGAPTQWIRIKLPAVTSVSKLRLIPSQYPAGATIHKIYASTTIPSSGHGTLVRTLSGTLTSGQPVDVVFSPEITNAQYITIETTNSPSWVSWFEIQAFPGSVVSPSPTPTPTPTPTPSPTPTPLPTPYSLTLQSTSQNVGAANDGTKAIDGNATTFWSSGGSPVQWIRVKLPASGSVSKLRITPNQFPAGATVHKIYTSPTVPSSGHGTLVRTLSTTLQSGQPFDVVFSPALLNVLYLTIETTSSPSWVAWSELQAFP